jgi:hypothetical protein
VNHSPYLNLPELPEFLQKLSLYNPRGWQTRFGIRLLFLTGVRTGELAADNSRSARSGSRPVDHPAPDRQAASGRDAQSRQATAGRATLHRAVVHPRPSRSFVTLWARCGPTQRHLLAHRSELKKCINGTTLDAALKRTGYEDQLTRPRHSRNHLDGAQRDRLPQDLGRRAAFALGPEQGEFGLQPRESTWSCVGG